MRSVFIGVTCLLIGACGSTLIPTAPSVVVPTSAQQSVDQPIVGWVPRHHNIPASFLDQPEGPIVYLCATQLRPYYTTDTGVTVMEEDHYLQHVPCPATPIP